MRSLAAQQAAFALKTFSMRVVCSLLAISLLWLGCSKVLRCAGNFCLGKGWNKSGLFAVFLCSLSHNLAGTLQTPLTSRPPDPGDTVGMLLLSPLKQRCYKTINLCKWLHILSMQSRNGGSCSSAKSPECWSCRHLYLSIIHTAGLEKADRRQRVF